jgi:ubiquinone/menaquinone biosynthesis C-methylase UbiE
VYSDPEGYQSYMGRWSARLAPAFLRFACRNPPTSVLDIGCGTGSLLLALVKAFRHSRLTGIDPSLPFIERARAALGPGASDYVIGAAEHLPFRDGVFDCSLSLLVLHEIRDRGAALKEMHRVTKQGGIVAACQWDFEHGMPMISALHQALAAVAPDLHQRTKGVSARAFTSLHELEAAWGLAGLRDVETARLTITLSYKNFADFWSPVLAGSTPTTAIVAALPPDTQEAVGRELKEFVPDARNGGAFSFPASAFAIAGRASG